MKPGGGLRALAYPPSTPQWLLPSLRTIFGMNSEPPVQGLAGGHPDAAEAQRTNTVLMFTNSLMP